MTGYTDRRWCVTCVRHGIDVRYPHYHPTGDEDVEYVKEHVRLPRDPIRVPRAFRSDLSDLCNSGKATAQRVIDLMEKHGLKLVRNTDGDTD